MFIAFLVLWLCDISKSAIVCTALSHEAVRVTWFYQPLTEAESTKFVISWFSVESFIELTSELSNGYRSYVDYLYENDILRYNYDASYEEVLEDVASSIGFTTLYYEVITDTDFFVIRNGIIPNHTLDIAIRRVFTSTNQRPDTLPRDDSPLHCFVKIPNDEDLESTTEVLSTSSYRTSTSTPWMWMVIVPGAFLFFFSGALVAYKIFQQFRKLHSQSKVGLIADSWKATSNSGGRHWVVQQRSPSPLSEDGASVDYTRSSLHSGGTEAWDELYHRHPLTTVKEEPDGDVDIHGCSNHQRPVNLSLSYGQKRISTPQVQPIAVEHCWTEHSTPPSTLDSMSLSCWTDDDVIGGASEHPTWRMFSRDRKYRRVAPANKRRRRETPFIFVDEETNLLHEGAKPFLTENNLSVTSTQTRRRNLRPSKRGLHPTYSSMDILSL